MSVVIPMLNEQGTIGINLGMLARQTLLPDEIIVMDGGSTDSSLEIAGNFERVHIVRASPPVGAQRQFGLERASGDTVVFMDCDTQPGPRFLEQSLDAFEKANADVACPRFLPVDSDLFTRLVYWFYNGVFRLTQSFLPSGGGMCILARREFALAAGGFRTDLVYEDIEFIRKCGRAGRYRVLPTAMGVSDRRFRSSGSIRTALQYLALSFFFAFGAFKAAEVIRYPFGSYDSIDSESVSLVDEDGREVGYLLKSLVHSADTPLHKAFSVFLFNPAGDLLLQRRSANKKTWPRVWSNSCCGHPLPGETTKQAAMRRLRSELGIRKSELRVVLPDFRYCAEMNGIVESEICPVLTGRIDEEPIPNPEEVESVRWVTWPEMLKLAADPASGLSPWCVEETKLLDDLFQLTEYPQS